MRVAIYTLGCKVNQYETQAMEQELQRRGHTLVDFESPADAYIINTCSVTAVSDKKSRQMIRRAKSRNPQAVVAACGCYVQTHTPEAQELGIDLIGGTGDRMEFLTLLEQAAEDHRSRVAVDEALRRRTFEVLPAGGMAARTRAMLKVEDGCVNFCTYCIIPYARGPVRSLPLEEAVRQTEQLRREGYREVVFTGIEISSWGQDFKDGRSLIDLLEAVSQAAGEMRLRLGSLEPRTVTEDFCRRAARLPNLCPQFHLSMQSGCDATLRRMNRRYDTARFLRSVTLLRQYFPRPAITTDLICGFPGETEEEFSQTLAFLRRCDFAQMHIFPYSIRPGTKAAEMEQVPGPVKEERAARAAAVAAELHRAYLQGCVGQTYPVLFEQRKDGCAAGHAPNYMEVLADGEQLHPVVGVDGGSVARTLLLGLQLLFEGGEVHADALFAGDQLREVDRETERIVEFEGVLARNKLLAFAFGSGDHAVQQVDARGERAQERGLLLLDHFFDQSLLGLQLGELAAHLPDQSGNQAAERRLGEAEVGVAVAHGAAQDAADDIARLDVRRQLAVGDREGDGAQVVGDHAHGHVGLPVLAVFLARHLRDAADRGLENVGVVVRLLAL